MWVFNLLQEVKATSRFSDSKGMSVDSLRYLTSSQRHCFTFIQYESEVLHDGVCKFKFYSLFNLFVFFLQFSIRQGYWLLQRFGSGKIL